MIEYVHPDQLPKLILELSKPDRTIVGRLKNSFNKRQSIKLGQINELEFTIPYLIEQDGELVRNAIVDKIRSQYHVKATFGEQVEWYVISHKENVTSDDGKSFLHVQLKSLGYQLKNKKLKVWVGALVNGEYRKESLNAQQVLDDLLSSSAWSISYIDAEFLTKYRSFDFSGTTVLDAIFTVAETFGAIIQWDTVNKSISLVKQENVGINKGFRVSERKYLKSINKEEKSDEIVTRLKVYGKDGLSINRVNPLGTDYLEDYSYFLNGFERDANKNVISSSPYMSDSLCNALLDYQIVIQNNKGTFDNLLSQKESLESQYVTKDGELVDLETQLKVVENTIDLKQTTGADASAEITQKASLQSQIATKKTEIANVISQISSVDTEITSLKTTLSIENNLTAAQIIELDNYVIEEEWEDQNYTDDEELYADAQKVFNDLKKPKEIISTNIINVFKLLEGKQDWKKVNIGDKFYIDYERFGIDVETQLIELEIDHDGNDINVTFANTKDIERDEDKLSKILYGSISTANTVNMGKYKWEQINNVQNEVNDLINNAWDSAKRSIMSGVNNSVEINGRGITVTSSDDPNKVIRINNGVIGLSQDNMNTFKTAITADGIVAERLIGKVIAGNNLTIQNQSGNYSIDGNGFTITSTDTNKRVLLDVNNGLKFQAKVNGVYSDKLYYDNTNSQMTLKGTLDADEIKVKGSSVLTADKMKINGQFVDQITTNQLVAGTAKITSAMIDTLNVSQLTGGAIKTVTLDVNQDAAVGQNLYIAQAASGQSAWFTSSALKFGNYANITCYGTGEMVMGTPQVTVPGNMFFGGASTSSKMYGKIDFSNATVSGLNVTVSFG